MVMSSLNVINVTKNLQGSLNMHMQTVHEGLKFPCDECDKQFTQKGYLNVHMKSVHEGKTFICDKCEKRFINCNKDSSTKLTKISSLYFRTYNI